MTPPFAGVASLPLALDSPRLLDARADVEAFHDVGRVCGAACSRSVMAHAYREAVRLHGSRTADDAELDPYGVVVAEVMWAAGQLNGSMAG